MIQTPRVQSLDQKRQGLGQFATERVRGGLSGLSDWAKLQERGAEGGCSPAGDEREIT